MKKRRHWILSLPGKYEPEGGACGGAPTWPVLWMVEIKVRVAPRNDAMGNRYLLVFPGGSAEAMVVFR